MWDAPLLALTSLQLPVLSLMHCTPNLLRFDPFFEAFLCFSALWRHHRAVISAENIWSKVLGRACGAEAKALPTCSQVILATGCQGGFWSVLAPAPALLLLRSSSRGAVRRCQKELRQLRSQRENAESCSRTRCAQALTLKSDSLDNYLCKTKKPRDKQSQSRDTWSGQSRGR